MTHSNDERRDELEEELANLWKETETEFRCPHCGLRFGNAHWLSTTITGGHLYFCPDCGKTCDFPNGGITPTNSNSEEEGR